MYYCNKCNNKKLLYYIICNSNDFYNSIKYNNTHDEYIFGLCLLYSIIKNDINTLQRKASINCNITPKLDNMESSLFDSFYFY